MKKITLGPDRRWRLSRVQQATDAGKGVSLLGAMAAGGAQLRLWTVLRDAGWVTFVPDPSITGTERAQPMMAVITDAGRSVLENP